MGQITLLSSIERPTLSARVARYLLDVVQREHLRPGDAVLSEIEIGRALQVSRGCVREAYRTLAALGILEIESGRRPRLKSLDPRVLTQIFDYALDTAQVTQAQVLETRRALELQTAQTAALNASDAQRRTLRELALQMKSAAANQARRVASDIAIHMQIAEAGGNPLNCVLLEALRSPLEESVRTHHGDERSKAQIARLVEAHERIVECVCVGDAAGAALAMSAHFDLSIHNAARATAPRARATARTFKQRP